MILTCKTCGSDAVTEIYSLGVATPMYLCLDCGDSKVIRRGHAEAPRRDKPTVGLLVYRQRMAEKNLEPTAMERTLTSTNVQEDLVALLRELEEGC